VIFCDAEVEQLGYTFSSHQDIAGLDVAMDDQVLVSVVYGGAEAAEKFQPLRDRQSVRLTIAIDGLAFDQLHHEVGKAILGCATVNESRDIRVLQTGQNLSLVLEALQDELSVEAASH
jgi:hypothetical protein